MAGTYRYAIDVDGQMAELPDTSQWSGIPALHGETELLIGEERGNTSAQVIVPHSSSVTAVCDEAAVIVTRAQQLLPILPVDRQTLMSGMVWNDSVTTFGCRGSVPATSTVWRTFTVVGDTLIRGDTALQIVRRDSIVAQGEGKQGYHRVVLRASGVGQTRLFFETTRGVFLGSVGEQRMQLAVTTSGKTSHFAQRVTERVTLKP